MAGIQGYGFCFGKVGSVIDLADALLAFAFPQHQPDGS